MNSKTIFKDRRLSKYDKALIIAMIFFIIIIAQGIFGEKGFLSLMDAEKEKEILRKEIEKLEQENSNLKQEIEDLKNNKFALEKKAREKLLYSKEGETIILVPKDNKKNNNKK